MVQRPKGPSEVAFPVISQSSAQIDVTSSFRTQAPLRRVSTSSVGEQKAAARRLGVDEGTLAEWEQRRWEPAGTLLDRVKRFVQGEEEGRRADERRAG